METVTPLSVLKSFPWLIFCSLAMCSNRSDCSVRTSWESHQMISIYAILTFSLGFLFGEQPTLRFRGLCSFFLLVYLIISVVLFPPDIVRLLKWQLHGVTDCRIMPTCLPTWMAWQWKNTEERHTTGKNCVWRDREYFGFSKLLSIQIGFEHYWRQTT